MNIYNFYQLHNPNADASEIHNFLMAYDLGIYVPHYNSRIREEEIVQRAKRVMLAKEDIIINSKIKNLACIGKSNNIMEIDDGTQRPLTLGENRVQRNFNPSANKEVEVLKQKYAYLIDFLEQMKSKGKGIRELAIAQTELETSCMYAVKSLFI